MAGPEKLKESEKQLGKLDEECQDLLRSGIAITSVAQCVEELVLNSVDAGSTCIAVRIDLPCGRIQCVDNGSGMTRDQLEKVAQRYSTSKCKNLEDITHNLGHYGYRGEALASMRSIAAVVEIQTRSTTKTYLREFVDGNPKSVVQAKVQRPSAGTTITIHDLFNRLPVRKKHLNVNLEIERIRQRMEGIALIHPWIAFSLRNDDSNQLILKTSKSNSVAGTFGQLFTSAKSRCLCDIKNSLDEFEVTGYVSKEGHHNKNLQFVYVNGRLVLKSKVHRVLNWMISRSSISRKRHEVVGDNGSPTRITSERYGVYVINVTCPLSQYDITFDPQKTLIEFKSWGTLLRCLEKAVGDFFVREGLKGEKTELDESPGLQKFLDDVDVINEDVKGDDSKEQSESASYKYGNNISTWKSVQNKHSISVCRPRQFTSMKDLVKDANDIGEISGDSLQVDGPLSQSQFASPNASGSDYLVSLSENESIDQNMDTRGVLPDTAPAVRDKTFLSLSEASDAGLGSSKFNFSFESSLASFPCSSRKCGKSQSRNTSRLGESQISGMSQPTETYRSSLQKFKRHVGKQASSEKEKVGQLKTEDVMANFDVIKQRIKRKKTAKDAANTSDLSQITSTNSSLEFSQDKNSVVSECKMPIFNIPIDENEAVTSLIGLKASQDQDPIPSTSQEPWTQLSGDKRKFRPSLQENFEEDVLVSSLPSYQPCQQMKYNADMFCDRKRKAQFRPSYASKLSKISGLNLLEGRKRSHDSDSQQAFDSSQEFLSTGSLVQTVHDLGNFHGSSERRSCRSSGREDYQSLASQFDDESQHVSHRPRSRTEEYPKKLSLPLPLDDRDSIQSPYDMVPLKISNNERQIHSLDNAAEPILTSLNSRSYYRSLRLRNDDKISYNKNLASEPEDTCMKSFNVKHYGSDVPQASKVEVEDNLISFSASSTLPFTDNLSARSDFRNHHTDNIERQNYEKKMVATDSLTTNYGLQRSSQSIETSIDTNNTLSSSKPHNSIPVFLDNPFKKLKSSSERDEDSVRKMSGEMAIRNEQSTLKLTKPSSVEKCGANICEPSKTENSALQPSVSVENLKKDNSDDIINEYHARDMSSNVAPNDNLNSLPRSQLKHPPNDQTSKAPSHDETVRNKAMSVISSSSFVRESPCESEVIETQSDVLPEIVDCPRTEDEMSSNKSSPVLNLPSFTSPDVHHSTQGFNNVIEAYSQGFDLGAPGTQEFSISVDKSPTGGHCDVDGIVSTSEINEDTSRVESQRKTSKITCDIEGAGSVSHAQATHLKSATDSRTSKGICEAKSQESCSRNTSNNSKEVDDCRNREIHKSNEEIPARKSDVLINDSCNDKDGENHASNDAKLNPRDNENFSCIGESRVDDASLALTAESVDSAISCQSASVNTVTDGKKVTTCSYSMESDRHQEKSCVERIISTPCEKEPISSERQNEDVLQDDIEPASVRKLADNVESKQKCVVEEDSGRLTAEVSAPSIQSAATNSNWTDTTKCTITVKPSLQETGTPQDKSSTRRTTEVGNDKEQQTVEESVHDVELSDAELLAIDAVPPAIPSTSQCEDTSKKKKDNTTLFVGPSWICKVDPVSGDKVYVNRITGSSTFENPTLSLADVWKGSSKNSAMSKSKTHKLLSDNASVFLQKVEQRKTDRCKSRGEDTTEAEDSAEIKDLVDLHLGNLDIDSVAIKWRQGAAPHVYERMTAKGDGPPVLTVDSMQHKPTQYESRLQYAIHPQKITRSMLNTMKVLGQLDNKFIACAMQKDDPVGTSSDLNSWLLVVIDQHAAHERIRLEQLREEIYEEGDNSVLKSSELNPELDLTMQPEDIRLMAVYRKHLSSLGITFEKDPETQSGIKLKTLPECFVDGKSHQLKQGRATVVPTVIQIMLKKRLELLQTTGGVCATLPTEVHNLLCLEACHGAIKFGDALSLKECNLIVENLCDCKLPFQCAHGRPSVMPLLDLEKMACLSESAKKSKPRLKNLKLRMEEEKNMAR